MKAYLGCDIGRTRPENQDSVRAESYPDGVLALVCDGMGGMQNGSAASKIAVAAAEDFFRAAYDTDLDAEAICEIFRECASDANRKVYQAAMLDPHTCAELSIDDIVSMCDDLFEAHKDWMPAYH